MATKIAEDRTAGTSAWRIEAGGRLGMVFGEDGVELSPPAPTCTSHCQVRDQVRGSLPVPGGEIAG